MLKLSRISSFRPIPKKHTHVPAKTNGVCLRSNDQTRFFTRTHVFLYDRVTNSTYMQSDTVLNFLRKISWYVISKRVKNTSSRHVFVNVGNWDRANQFVFRILNSSEILLWQTTYKHIPLLKVYEILHVVRSDINTLTATITFSLWFYENIQLKTYWISCCAHATLVDFYRHFITWRHFVPRHSRRLQTGTYYKGTWQAPTTVLSTQIFAPSTNFNYRFSCQFIFHTWQWRPVGTDTAI